jgi:hypothetical protein
MSVLQITESYLHGFTTPQRKTLEKLLHQMFPIDNVAESRTTKGNLSTKALTQAVAMRLGALGFEEPAPVSLPGTAYGLEPDFFRRAAGELGGIAAELQFALRECVVYDLLKHARLQRDGFCGTSIEIVPTANLAQALNNACATFAWAQCALEQLVLPVHDFRVALVGLELQAGQREAAGAASEAMAVQG